MIFQYVKPSVAYIDAENIVVVRGITKEYRIPADQIKEVFALERPLSLNIVLQWDKNEKISMVDKLYKIRFLSKSSLEEAIKTLSKVTNIRTTVRRGC